LPICSMLGPFCGRLVLPMPALPIYH